MADPAGRSPDLEWGKRTAESLWTAYAATGAKLAGARILDFGCAWGYFCALALERGCREAVGIDLHAHWQRLDDPSFVAQPGLSLLAGDILLIPEVQRQSFDLIVSSGTLFLLRSEYLEQVLAWFFDHLRPGGEALLRTRCVTAKTFNDLGTRLKVPGAQLLFSRRDIDGLLLEKGHTQLKSHLAYTGASWIFACRSAGFDVLDVRRFGNGEVLGCLKDHQHKVQEIDPVELATGEILIRLQKPVRSPELSPLRKPT
jgi:SAM-dependent methyltransferase